MADLIASGTSGYQLGEIDTATTVVDAPAVNKTPVAARIPNGLSAAIVQIETILGVGTTLKGTLSDLATRLAVQHNADGTHKNLIVSEGGTGTTVANLGKRLAGLNTTTLQFLDYMRISRFTSNGAFTVPAGVTSFFVEVLGAGGGGGGGGGASWDSSGGQLFTGGDGSRGRPGGYASHSVTTTTPGSIFTVTIGAAGTAGSAGAAQTNANGVTGGNGGAGGTTTITDGGTTVQASGGAGGIGGQGGQFVTGTHGVHSRSETLADGIALVATVGRDGHGSAPGKAGAGGVGTAGSPAPGTAGTAGIVGQVVFYY